ncbi:MAG: hypothetical protein JNM04_05015 [Chthonomonas sp.]|nr:hypothetical protein [Chthonomonas sp.]
MNPPLLPEARPSATYAYASSRLRLGAVHGNDQERVPLRMCWDLVHMLKKSFRNVFSMAAVALLCGMCLVCTGCSKGMNYILVNEMNADVKVVLAGTKTILSIKKDGWGQIRTGAPWSNGPEFHVYSTTNELLKVVTVAADDIPSAEQSGDPIAVVRLRR